MSLATWLRNCRRRAKDNPASPDSRLPDHKRQVRHIRDGQLKIVPTNEAEIGHSGFSLGASVPSTGRRCFLGRLLPLTLLLPFMNETAKGIVAEMNGPAKLVSLIHATNGERAPTKS